jgi:hypothetical protein
VGGFSVFREDHEAVRAYRHQLAKAFQRAVFIDAMNAQVG